MSDGEQSEGGDVADVEIQSMARNFGHARAVNIHTWENLKQYGYTKL